MLSACQIVFGLAFQIAGAIAVTQLWGGMAGLVYMGLWMTTVVCHAMELRR